MPTTTPCQYCGSVGFVRKENVIKADAAYVHYYCGHCNSSWTWRSVRRTVHNVAMVFAQELPRHGGADGWRPRAVRWESRNDVQARRRGG